MIKNFTERPSTSPYIEMIWQAEMLGRGDHTLPAKGRWDIIFIKKNQGAETLLVGPADCAQVKTYTEEEAIYLGIRLKTGVCISQIRSNVMLGKTICIPASPHCIRWASGLALQAPSFENAELFVKKLEHHGLISFDPVVIAHLQGAGSLPSARTVQRHYLRATGLTPQYIAIIERAHEAYELLQKNNKATHVAYDVGYTDSAHLTHSFQKILGTLPSKVSKFAA